MADSETQIHRIILNVEGKLLDVVRRAIKNTVDEAQLPVSKGGKMPVDTGFLSWSGVAALNKLPSGEERGRKRKKGDSDLLYSGQQGEDLDVVLARMKIGDTFYWGWTAKYAKYQEVYKGFLESALRNFKSHITKAASEYRK